LKETTPPSPPLSPPSLRKEEKRHRSANERMILRMKAQMEQASHEVAELMDLRAQATKTTTSVRATTLPPHLSGRRQRQQQGQQQAASTKQQKQQQPKEDQKQQRQQQREKRLQTHAEEKGSSSSSLARWKMAAEYCVRQHEKEELARAAPAPIKTKKKTDGAMEVGGEVRGFARETRQQAQEREGEKRGKEKRRDHEQRSSGGGPASTQSNEQRGYRESKSGHTSWHSVDHASESSSKYEQSGFGEAEATEADGDSVVELDIGGSVIEYSENRGEADLDEYAAGMLSSRLDKQSPTLSVPKSPFVIPLSKKTLTPRSSGSPSPQTPPPAPVATEPETRGGEILVFAAYTSRAAAQKPIHTPSFQIVSDVGVVPQMPRQFGDQDKISDREPLFRQPSTLQPSGEAMHDFGDTSHASLGTFKPLSSSSPFKPFVSGSASGSSSIGGRDDEFDSGCSEDRIGSSNTESTPPPAVSPLRNSLSSLSSSPRSAKSNKGQVRSFDVHTSDSALEDLRDSGYFGDVGGEDGDVAIDVLTGHPRGSIEAEGNSNVGRPQQQHELLSSALQQAGNVSTQIQRYDHEQRPNNDHNYSIQNKHSSQMNQQQHIQQDHCYESPHRPYSQQAAEVHAPTQQDNPQHLAQSEQHQQNHHQHQQQQQQQQQHKGVVIPAPAQHLQTPLQFQPLSEQGNGRHPRQQVPEHHGTARRSPSGGYGLDAFKEDGHPHIRPQQQRQPQLPSREENHQSQSNFARHHTVSSLKGTHEVPPSHSLSDAPTTTIGMPTKKQFNVHDRTSRSNASAGCSSRSNTLGAGRGRSVSSGERIDHRRSDHDGGNGGGNECQGGDFGATSLRGESPSYQSRSPSEQQQRRRRQRQHDSADGSTAQHGARLEGHRAPADDHPTPELPTLSAASGSKETGIGESPFGSPHRASFDDKAGTSFESPRSEIGMSQRFI